MICFKKLSQSSQFEISTQAGTTKILGTAFRIEQDARVSKVDVTDSTVSLTPTGKGQPILLTEGKGLDVTTDGIVAQLKWMLLLISSLIKSIIFSPNYLRRFPFHIKECS